MGRVGVSAALLRFVEKAIRVLRRLIGDWRGCVVAAIARWHLDCPLWTRLRLGAVWIKGQR